LPLAQKTTCEFSGNMLRVGGRATVPGNEQLATLSQGRADEVNGARYRRGESRKHLGHFEVFGPDGSDLLVLWG
jgi:hypothetical protein